MKRTLLLLAFVLSACTTAPVHLRNPSTGEVATCGPYLLDGGLSESQAIRESKCIDDYQRQGFYRAP